ncbi:MAG: phage holin family protein [Elusimicrobia bacterium]|nr:phage holin family protein [Elusimicrobiota bacterium]
MKILLHILVSGVAVYATARLLPGVHVAGFGTAIVAAVVLGVVNGFVRPILLIVTLPINLLTLGLFTLVIIGGCVELAAWLVPGFVVDSFWWALAFAAVLWVVNSFLHGLERR